MKSKVIQHYLAVSKLIDKHLSIHGARLYRELLSISLTEKKLKNVISYACLEEKLGCDNNIISKSLKELEIYKFASVVQSTDSENITIALKDIFNTETNKDQLIGKRILC